MEPLCCRLQKDLVPVCRELGIGIVCYSPIGRGMLTGKYSKSEDQDPSDFRRSNPRFAEEAIQKVSLRQPGTQGLSCLLMLWTLGGGCCS